MQVPPAGMAASLRAGGVGLAAAVLSASKWREASSRFSEPDEDDAWDFDACCEQQAEAEPCIQEDFGYDTCGWLYVFSALHHLLHHHSFSSSSSLLLCASYLRHSPSHPLPFSFYRFFPSHIVPSTSSAKRFYTSGICLQCCCTSCARSSASRANTFALVLAFSYGCELSPQ